jgi:hypothetical protein
VTELKRGDIVVDADMNPQGAVAVWKICASIE